MPVDLSRKEFLEALAAPIALAPFAAARPNSGKLLIVVAHPDDEYACAAATYRLVRELGWTADQVVITNGEGGYRYSSLAERVYGKPLVSQHDGIAAVRREETLRAGKILGIRHHTFLEQKDLGFAAEPATASAGYWDRAKVVKAVHALLLKGEYDVVFTTLPTGETHAHHRAAADVTLEAVARLDDGLRPLILGAEARSRTANLLSDEGAPAALAFDRNASFGYQDALDYQIVVNWMIAEYKSQGLFQKDCGKHDLELFWPLGQSTGRSGAVLSELHSRLTK